MNIIPTEDQPPAAALVLFSDRTAIRWMRLLPRGFRHCSLILAQPTGGWLLVDSLANRVVLAPLDAAGLLQLLQRCVKRGDRVTPVRSLNRPTRRKRPMHPFTCVELTLRVLGFQPFFVLTPRQLFRILSGRCESTVDK